MFRSAIKGQRLASLFLLGVLLFNYPLLALFNRTATLARHPRALRCTSSARGRCSSASLALVVERSR